MDGQVFYHDLKDIECLDKKLSEKSTYFCFITPCMFLYQNLQLKLTTVSCSYSFTQIDCIKLYRNIYKDCEGK